GIRDFHVTGVQTCALPIYGMNLVAKEFVAAQDPNDPGVLVLSRFAGAACQLDGALLVNPHDPGEMADAMRHALSMPLAERRSRYQRMWAVLCASDIEGWRNRYLSDLRRVGHRSVVRPEVAVSV